MTEPTLQQLAKARETLPCWWSASCGNTDHRGERIVCPNCSLVPRVAALLAEQEARCDQLEGALKAALERAKQTDRWGYHAERDREITSLKAENQLARSLRKWSDIETEVEQRVSTRRIQAEFELNEMRAQCKSLRARLNLKHSASPTDATQALCGAPPPFVWDNDSGVFCPACKKVETIERETLEKAAHVVEEIRSTDKTIQWVRRKTAEAIRALAHHSPDEGEETA